MLLVFYYIVLLFSYYKITSVIFNAYGNLLRTSCHDVLVSDKTGSLFSENSLCDLPISRKLDVCSALRVADRDCVGAVQGDTLQIQTTKLSFQKMLE